MGPNNKCHGYTYIEELQGQSTRSLCIIYWFHVGRITWSHAEYKELSNFCEVLDKVSPKYGNKAAA